MNSMKKILALILTAALLLAPALPVSAAHVSAREAIETLETLGLAEGTDNGFEPEKSATRAQSVVMLLRLLGEASEAENYNDHSPFQDAGWADRYLSYAYHRGLVEGVTDTLFESDSPVSARDFTTMALRALGYTEGVDFTWWESLSFSDAIGLTHGEYSGAETAFLREDMALISYTALTLNRKDSGRRLIESLYAGGAVTAEGLKQTRFANAVNTGRTVYTAEQIHEMASSAVFYAAIYATEEEIERGRNSGEGSGFLISPDGVAVMSWHELDGAERVEAVATDGRTFPMESVLFYDPFWDAAVVRLSMTDTEGETVRSFPYLDLGDSDTLSTGEPVYTVSNPLGLIDTVTSGLVSHPGRVVDDPAYPCIQITAPIASGSSGGALFNQYGEVVGILFASYTRGENMNLAVPVNCFRDVDMSSAGMAFSEVAAAEQEKKDNAAITADTTALTLAAGESTEIEIYTDYPGNPVVRYEIDDTSVVGCQWGAFVTKQSVLLKFTGGEPGSTQVHITYAEDGNPDAELVFDVTVTEAPAAEE